ncbi:hypothetical protein BP00DRAFT_267021 [Aspergillus indologenus CBS 114.80]|uniref:Uncharacterized protein n=1 Tax=Aspergillus indologenus CBS 114.80 TaxID=1450541 RepID=A0A2V5ILL8_9EURO|nr:hypothetical protein BP00DRAFT_267021 [Aspergillus indologenus CBS 114.80]
MLVWPGLSLILKLVLGSIFIHALVICRTCWALTWIQSTRPCNLHNPGAIGRECGIKSINDSSLGLYSHSNTIYSVFRLSPPPPMATNFFHFDQSIAL